MRRVLLWVLAQRQWPRAVRCILAAALVGVVAGVAHVVPGPTHILSLLLFLPAVFLAALLFDRGSGLLATAVAVLVAGLELAEWSGGSAPAWGDDGLLLLVFAALGVLLGALAELLHDVIEQLIASERDYALRLRETTHSIRNHLQIAASLLRMQARTAGASSELDIAANRIQVLGGLYERLSLRRPDASVASGPFIGGLVGELRATIGPLRPVTIEAQVDDVRLAGRCASTVGLIVNELVTNAIKHAFPDGRAGRILVEVRRCGEGGLEVTVGDDGVGMAERATPRPLGRGRDLVHELAAQVGGCVSVRGDGGVRTTLTLPASCLDEA